MNKIQNTDLVLPGGLGQVVIGGAVSEIQKVFKANDGSVTVTIGPARNPEVGPITIEYTPQSMTQAEVRKLIEHKKK